MRSLNAFMLQRGKTHTLCDPRTRVCVCYFVRIPHILFKWWSQNIMLELYEGHQTARL